MRVLRARGDPGAGTKTALTFLIGYGLGALVGVGIFDLVIGGFAHLTALIERTLPREPPVWWPPVAALVIVVGVCAGAIWAAVWYAQAG